MWINRHISPLVETTLAKRPAILLTGARQTGKTSLAKRLFPDYGYVSLDIPALAQEADEAGLGFLERHPIPLIIDEVQYAPRLFRYLKHVIDSDRNRCNQYVLTGSQKFVLMQYISESLAGRISVFECHSLSAAELEKGLSITLEGQNLARCIVKGGYPEIYARDLSPTSFYSDYLVTYLERDVRQIVNVRNIRDFDRFIRLAASRSGQLLSINGFSSDLGISPNTVKSWLSVLEASGIIQLVAPWFKNYGKRIVKSPKIFFLDSGLLCYLLGITDGDALKASPAWGHVFETFVFGQLVRQSAIQGINDPIYFFRDHGGLEVDFVRQRQGKIELIEVKTSESPSQRSLPFEKVRAFIPEEQIAACKVIRPVRSRFTSSSGVLMSNVIDL